MNENWYKKITSNKNNLYTQFENKDDEFWGIEENEEGSVFKDTGLSAVTCTGYACAILKKLGSERVNIYGFNSNDNPKSSIAKDFYGHDFAVIDERYIVDPWLKDVETISERIIFDLENPNDNEIIEKLYGDKSKWKNTTKEYLQESNKTSEATNNLYKFSENDSEQIYKKELNIPIPDSCMKIIQDLKSKGNLSLIVGGSVRDALMNYPSKDIDIEVYGINYEDLVKTLKPYGKVNLVGKAFGVVKLVDENGQDYDFSVPRRDSKTDNDPSQLGKNKGDRGRGISAEFEPNISPKEAASRRDFTFNSLSYNPLTKEIHDYFGGINDIEQGIIRATSSQFTEDPLRVLRGMQFAARFGFKLAPETAEMARSLKEAPLVKERESEEWMKLFTKGKYPGNGIQFLIDTGWIERYPELNGIIGISQDPRYHPEGVTVRKIIRENN